jgi:dipeptidyl aminopeptidase/acylaminoacyl peptidase
MVMLHQYLPLRRWRLNVHRGFHRLRVFSEPTLMALAMTLFASLANGGVRDERPFTVDDLLKLSDVGRAAVRPGTNTFVWEQSPPYDTLGDYGAGTTGTWQGSDYEIFTVESGSNVPRKLFQPRERTTYLLGDFSSDGRFLTLLATRDGEVRAAVFDFQQRRLREFPLAPRFLVLNVDWAWLDNRHLAIAAHPDGEGPWPLTFRRGIGSHLTQSWEKSWKGQEASVDQYDSSATDVDRPLPGRLVIVDVESGHIEQLASGQFSALRPSPDGRWLAAVRQSMLPQSTLEHPHIDFTYARSVLTVFSLTGGPGEREISPDLDVLPDSMEWNPSSQGLAFFASHAGTELRSGDFWIADPSSAAAKVVPHAGLSLVSQRAGGGPQWPERAVWFNDSLAVFARSTPGQPGTLAFEDIERKGVVDSRVAVLSVPAHWFLLSAHSAPRDLTPGMQQVSPRPVLANGTRFIVVSDGRAWSLYASAPPSRLFPQFDQRLDALTNPLRFQAYKTNGGEGFFPVIGEPGKLARIEIDDGSTALKLVAIPPATSVLATAKSGVALAQVGAGKGAELALIGPDGSGLRTLGELNPFLDQIAETRWTDFDYSNVAGSQRAHLSGCLLLPTDYQSGHRYPLIVEVYPDRPGGCGSAQRRNQFAMGARPTSYSEHLLAARGFIVFRPDTGGGISRTAAGPQAALSEVVDRGVDAVIAAGYGDPDRIGLMGFSQGGFASLWIATQSHRYKAVVSLNGWSDLTHNFFSMGWEQQLAPTEMTSGGGAERYLTPAGSDFSMGGTPWKFPQRYIQNSPLWRSDTVSAPVLLIHSDMDSFDVTDYTAFFTSLYIQKKDARLLIYRGEGHSPSSPANIRDMWKNIFSWFDRYLNVKRDSEGKMILGD